MARKPASKAKSKAKTKAKSAGKANKKASRAAVSTAKAGRKKVAAKSLGKPAAKAPVKKPAASKAKPGKRGNVLKAAKKVLSSVAVTAKDAVNLAVASAIARTAAKAAKAEKAGKINAAKLAAATEGVLIIEGALAPDFRLPRDGGGIASATDFAGKNVVLFFYPRADTPGCTREAMDFTRLSAQFEAADTAVLGVSADTVKAQDAFREKHCLGVPLVSDETHDLIGAFGVWGEKSMYGKTFMGIVRTTVLVGKDGRVAKIWRSVSVDGHAEEVLAAAKAI